MGSVVTGAVIVVMAIVWLVLSSSRFANWFASTGEPGPEAIQDPAEVSEEQACDSAVETETADADVYGGPLGQDTLTGAYTDEPLLVHDGDDEQVCQTSDKDEIEDAVPGFYGYYFLLFFLTNDIFYMKGLGSGLSLTMDYQ